MLSVNGVVEGFSSLPHDEGIDLVCCRRIEGYRVDPHVLQASDGLVGVDVGIIPCRYLVCGRFEREYIDVCVASRD